MAPTTIQKSGHTTAPTAIYRWTHAIAALATAATRASTSTLTTGTIGVAIVLLKKITVSIVE